MINNNLITIFLIAFSLVGCNKNIKNCETKAPPLVDGDIRDFIDLGVKPIKITDDVNLYIYQNLHYVWLGYSYPKDSYGTMDMELITPKIKDTLNLHVSAQIGEWPLNKPHLAPQKPESDKWWNMKGWIANEVWPNGMDKSGQTPRYQFKNGKARELQLSTKRFGKGIWKFKLNIRSIKGKKNKFYNTSFPSDKSFYKLELTNKKM